MTKFRYRLVLAVLTVTLLVMAGLGLVIGQIFKNVYLENLTDRLKKETYLAASMVENEAVLFNEVQTLTEEISQKLDARVTIILADGTVVGESAADPAEMENHADRPEFTELEEGIVRYSTTVETELLFYAVPIQNEANETIGYVRLGLPIEAVNSVNRTLWAILIVSFTIAFLVIVSVTYRIANQMIRPIESATVVANKLAEGDYQARTSEESRDEVGQLNRSINVLAYNLEQLTKRHQVQKERLETLIENMGSGLILINTRGDISLINKTCHDIFQEDTDLWLHQLYHDVIKHKEIIKIVQDIFLTEKRQRRQVKLPIHLEYRHFDVHGAPIVRENGKLKGIALVFHDITELKKLEQVRKDFVANVSHELKTPVTSIKGFTETLLDGAMHDEQLRDQFLHIIWKESERLQSLIHDLLELSKIEQNYFQLNWQQTNLFAVVSEVMTLLKGKAEEKGIDISLSAEGSFDLEGDPERLKQIAINLVNNAITYTSNGGRIDLALKDHGDVVEFEVNDTGIGIRESEIPRIFERFYRVDRARSRNSGGTGLGLAIVKHLVEAHQGKILVESEFGKGTTFTIQFHRYRDDEEKS
ncbi:ATP-binding protein [Halalkalibacterium halodurans]|jgi:two-component system phosphate regulon sensor histidine kinase PhoR|uniref:histidine kinase n=1 Tax=Halalkalibacterium halodurans (strain ATCC BAA-125 / DSM 18197 / FERM 7344 / JCM 9153 / C-125) TaxID=272558 RepID=Q9K851_HALH5|nr:ATP-binding protein [Halalkalibacterium halodurans]MED3648002.1 ATP-binding protein [Halalkalibacterium halodurans]MED4082138.1 ATP-binding protein [Halalkalibacterium halodurans]MED4084284.1 ATP-binding protein [Halalkalibacterium halodurans]MED4103593.1 ATP-binding protein [Halalkalibacterium halodurans]MED4107560.1 ATP-binding protein [Halalkalibacterium halodurans]